MLVLLSAVLEQPHSHDATDHLHAIQRFIDYLVRLKEDGCHVDRMIEGCSKLHRVPSHAVKSSTQRNLPDGASMASRIEVNDPSSPAQPAMHSKLTIVNQGTQPKVGISHQLATTFPGLTHEPFHGATEGPRGLCVGTWGGCVG